MSQRRRVTDRQSPFEEYGMTSEWPPGNLLRRGEGTVTVSVWLKTPPTREQTIMMADVARHVAMKMQEEK